MSEELCASLSPQYRAIVSRCYQLRRQELQTLGVEKAQENFIQCITQIPDPKVQACVTNGMTNVPCNCDGKQTTKFRKKK